MSCSGVSTQGYKVVIFFSFLLLNASIVEINFFLDKEVNSTTCFHLFNTID